MSGLTLDDAHDTKYASPFQIPLIHANENSLPGYGEIVRDLDDVQVMHVRWPMPGRRKNMHGAGILEETRLDLLQFKWFGDLCRTKGLDGKEPYSDVCRLPAGIPLNNRTCALFREANYHPDRSQSFFPTDNDPFVTVLAKPGDDVTPKDFVGFYFDGSFGLTVPPNVWHQILFPIKDCSVFYLKEGYTNACALFDSVEEFGKYMIVPLKMETI